MNAEEFREFGKAAIDFMADYLENIRDYDVLFSVEPGYLLKLQPEHMPEAPESWRNILSDIDKLIVPGLTHWQSPHMHGYYPSNVSYPAIVGELLSSGFNVIGLNWICSPAATELEVIVMDWLAKFLKLPAHFLHTQAGPGGGVLQGSASECVLVSVLAAREQAVRDLRTTYPELSESELRGKLVAYSSDQSNSCVEKAGVLAAVPVRLLPTDDDLVLRGATLKAAIEADIAAGMIPFICIATIGTTGTCAYDDIASLASVCRQHKLWLHVDAAYAGGAFALDEYADLRRGLEYVDSLNFNLHKFMLVNFDCSAMWLRDANKLIDSFNVDRIYLKHKYEGLSQMPEFRHWQISLGRRFRALKVWITFRTLGAEGLRSHMRRHIDLAAQFETLVKTDERLELVAPRALGLVCFRVKGDNKLTAQLLQRLMERKKIYMVSAEHRGRLFLRFAICGMAPKPSDIEYAWKEIETQLLALLAEQDQLTAIAKTSKLTKLTQQLTNDLQHTNGPHEKTK